MDKTCVPQISMYVSTRHMHIMLLILPIMLCSNSLPLALLCPKFLPIMPHYALKMSLKRDTNVHYTVKNQSLHSPLKATVLFPFNELLKERTPVYKNVDFIEQIEQEATGH